MSKLGRKILVHGNGGGKILNLPISYDHTIIHHQCMRVRVRVGTPLARRKLAEEVTFGMSVCLCLLLLKIKDFSKISMISMEQLSKRSMAK